MFLQLLLIPIDIHVPFSISLSSDGNLLKILFIILILNVWFQLLHVSMHLYKNFGKKSLKNAPEFLETGGDGQNNNKGPGKDNNKSFYQKYKKYIWIGITLISLSLFIYYCNYNINVPPELPLPRDINAANVQLMKELKESLDAVIDISKNLMQHSNLSKLEYETFIKLCDISIKVTKIYRLTIEDNVNNINIILQEKQLVLKMLNEIDVDVYRESYAFFEKLKRACS